MLNGGFLSHYVLPWAMAPDTIEYGAARSGMRLLIGPLPAALILIGNLALAFYTLDRKRYEEITKGAD